MGDDKRDPARSADYHHARVGAAAALTAAVIFLLVDDALSGSYEVSAVVVAAILGTIGALVGIEIRTDWRK
jgi:hypothetical protein